MKSFSCLFVVFGAFVGGTYACANQAVYDLCLKTGQTALGACGAPGTNPRCACAAQKQILACYSECPDDATVFQLGQIQSGQVQVFCSLPGAEAQVSNGIPSMIMATAPTMASPIRASATSTVATGTGVANGDRTVKDAEVIAPSAAKQPATTAGTSDAKRAASNWSLAVAVIGISLYMA